MPNQDELEIYFPDSFAYHRRGLFYLIPAARYKSSGVDFGIESSSLFANYFQT